MPASRGPAAFATTHWSLVLCAGQRDAAGSAEALEKLCAAYWFPLYAFARREGCAPEAAQDLVSPLPWQTVTNSPTLSDGEYRVSIPVQHPQKFYRLKPSGP